MSTFADALSIALKHTPSDEDLWHCVQTFDKYIFTTRKRDSPSSWSWFNLTEKIAIDKKTLKIIKLSFQEYCDVYDTSQLSRVADSEDCLLKEIYYRSQDMVRPMSAKEAYIILKKEHSSFEAGSCNRMGSVYVFFPINGKEDGWVVDSVDSTVSRLERIAPGPDFMFMMMQTHRDLDEENWVEFD